MLPWNESAITEFGQQNSITPEVLDNLLVSKKISEESGLPTRKVLLIDCRYDYEFKGGHIKGALNLSSKQQLEDFFF